jgi:hypothetical protein
MYQELLDNLTTAEENFQKFKKRYPELHVTTVFPKDLVSGVVNRLAKEYREEIFVDSQYLDDDEREDGLQIGSMSSKKNKNRFSRVNRRIKKEETALVHDLKDCVKLHAIYLTALYLEKSQITAKFTADMLDKQQAALRTLAEAKKAIERYHIEQCSKFFVLNDVDTFFFFPDTKNAPEVSCVYFLLVYDEIMYVGHSKNLQSRLRSNHVVRKYYLQGDYEDINCVYIPCSIERARELERTLISIAKPPYNKKGKQL